MPDVLAIFGSGSDREVFEPLMRALGKEGVSAALRISSAHKTPEELRKIVQQSDAKIIIAGAGLGAALPGVIASQTIKPVIGLPVGGGYGGLDALLAVHQMPPGIPVLGTGVGAWETAATSAKKMLERFKGVVLVDRGQGNDACNHAISKAECVLAGFKISYEAEKVPQFGGKHRIFIDFLPLGELALVQKTESLVITVPAAPASAGKPEDALKLLKNSGKGLFAGLNAGDNAALAAAEIMNLASGSYGKELRDYREALRKKVNDADRKESAVFG